jgi:hypothetical protein
MHGIDNRRMAFVGIKVQPNITENQVDCIIDLLLYEVRGRAGKHRDQSYCFSAQLYNMAYALFSEPWLHTLFLSLYNLSNINLNRGSIELYT